MNHKKTDNITISRAEYERLTRAETLLQTIVNTKSYNIAAIVEAVKHTLAAQEVAVQIDVEEWRI